MWIDVDIAQSEEARKLVASLNLCAPEIVDDAMSREPATQIARYDDYIHLVLSGCRLVGHKFDLERVDAMMGENFLLTLHKGQPVFLEAALLPFGALDEPLERGGVERRLAVGEQPQRLPAGELAGHAER